MNVNQFLATVLAIFLLGLPGCTKSTIPEAGGLSSAEHKEPLVF